MTIVRPQMPEPGAENSIDVGELREMALFLVRIFGEQAGEVAAERAQKSDQAGDWHLVGLEVEKLLADEAAQADGRPLRLFT